MKKLWTIFIALLVILVYAVVPGIVILNAWLFEHIVDFVTNEKLFSDLYVVRFIIFMILILALTAVSIYVLLLIAYNLYFLKSAQSTQVIYGLMEIFIATLLFIVLLFTQPAYSIYYDLASSPPYFLLFIAIYPIVFFVVRGMETIGKANKHKQQTLLWMKFGIGDQGELVHYNETVLWPSLYLERYNYGLKQESSSEMVVDQASK